MFSKIKFGRPPCLAKLSHLGRGNFSIRFLETLFASIAAIVSLLLTSDRKSSRCKTPFEVYLKRKIPSVVAGTTVTHLIMILKDKK